MLGIINHMQDTLAWTETSFHEKTDFKETVPLQTILTWFLQQGIQLIHSEISLLYKSQYSEKPQFCSIEVQEPHKRPPLQL